MADAVVIVGVLARVEDSRRAVVVERLEALPGVETFELESEGRLGVVLETTSLDAAHTCLREQINAIDGVLGTWPVSVEFEDAIDDGAAATVCRDVMAGSPVRQPANL